jgi:demethylmenaquinone methyltransferase/2-methoxy-6-polyprenyl-1,4-benzoquinol methylase
MNGIMSGGFDSRWRRLAAEAAKPRGARVLDLGTGTGALAAEMSRQGAARVVGLDFALPMLAAASAHPPQRLAGAPLISQPEWLAADALLLPFVDAAFDIVVAAFALRNLVDLNQGLREARRVLRPGGQLITLEIVIPSSGLFRTLFRPYFSGLVPLMGDLISEPTAYVYLPRSVDSFLTAAALAGRIEEAGFASVTYRPLAFGAVALHHAWAADTSMR